MVSLRSLVTGAVALLAAPIMAASTPDQIAGDLKTLTTQSQELQGPAESINPVNSALNVAGRGPFHIIVAGFIDITSNATVIASRLHETPTVTDSDGADKIYDAFREFDRALQTLLNILIKKADILDKVPHIGPPMYTALEEVAWVVDTVAEELIRIDELHDSDLITAADSLLKTLERCVNKYAPLSAKRSRGATHDAVKRDARVFVA